MASEERTDEKKKETRRLLINSLQLKNMRLKSDATRTMSFFCSIREKVLAMNCSSQELCGEL